MVAPSVRARHMKLFVERVRDLDADRRDAVLARIGPVDLDAIENASPLDWFPVEINVRATEAVWKALGPGAREGFFLRLGMEDFESPLLKGVVATALRLFGVEPGSLLKFAPRGWSQVFRDDATVTAASPGKGVATLTYAGLPAPLAESRIWIDSVAASMGAMFAVTKKRGTVTAEQIDVASGSMTLVFRWES